MTWLYAVWGLGGAALLLILVLFGIGMFAFNQTALRKKKRENYGIDEYFPENPEIKRRLMLYEHSDCYIRTTHNKNIECKFFSAGAGAQDKMIVLVHGLYNNMYSTSAHALMYLELGYDVLMYNQRSVGESQGKTKTYGYYERYDLASVLKYMKTNIQDKKIIVHGFSMGAATAAMHSELNEDGNLAAGYILDSPFSDLREAFLHTATKPRGPKQKPAGKFKKLFCRFMLSLSNILNVLFLRFSYRQVRPKEAVKVATAPMFIIHAVEDTVCPVSMGEEIFDCKVLGERRIWTPEHTSHIHAFFDYPEKYREKVIQFLSEIE